MSKIAKRCCLLAAASYLLMSLPSNAADGMEGNLVKANWLEKHLHDADLLLLDASPAQIYAEKHIPGAVPVDLFTYGLSNTPAAVMEKHYQSWGISPGKTIVMYDPGATMMATRLLFSLYRNGFPENKLFILDGGLAKWEEQKLPLTKESTPAPTQGSFKTAQIENDPQAELPEVLSASGDPPNNALIEALGPDWHFGATRPFQRAGHIPYAILAPSADFYNPDKTFKSPEELKQMLAYLGVQPEQQIYTYCGGGVAASVPYFAIRFILNYPHVKMFTGSELQWLSDERQLPYWTYDAPYLTRETAWLQFHGGRMARMYGLAKVSMVDVRPANEFNQGHAPFALNIPADVFKTNLASPEKLAEILGPAGVDASYEAVVMSGAGLTKDSALAFLALQALGQSKVSVYMDSLEKGAQFGFAPTKDATVVGPKKSPQDVSIPPTSYPANLREGVIIHDAESAPGIYPKLFIASGKEMPAKTPGDKVVHVSYSELVNDDGSLKAAKDIWTTLSKAGVPRYAELICFSDDPGEAAANYFVLKLMGFPDVKVLLI